MDKNTFLNKMLSILPTSIDTIEHIEIVKDSVILTTDSKKYTFKCYESDLKENNTECKTFYHKDIETGEVFYKDKVKYLTDKEAIEAAIRININPKTIHKRIIYKCTQCGFWHIGRNSTVLTDADKDKIKRKHLIKY